jgi:steroid delta-isomerase-like uncharacterized protein
MTAENAHEFARCIDTFHHARYEIIPTGEVWDGVEGVNTLLLENKTAFPDFKFVPESIQYADDAVYVEGRFTGTHLGSWRGLPATGRRVDFPVMVVFLFEGERLMCERTYFDINTGLRQIGIARDPNSLAGRLTTIMNHPLVIGGAFLKQLMRRG